MKHPTSIEHARWEPQREPPCIWVFAGVVNYRLCDRSYECEGCELFHALASGGVHSGTANRLEAPSDLDAPHPGKPAGSVSWTEEQVSSHLHHVLGDCRLYLDRHYRPPHFWLLRDADGEVRVGLASHVLRILSPIAEIVTPGVGLHLKRGQPCGWVIRDGMAISLSMPMCGVVREVNDAAFAAGGTGTHSGDPWLFRVEPSQPLSAVEGLLRGEEMLLWYLDSIRTLKRYLREAVSSPTADMLGPVMADGGARELCLEDVLGRARFEELLEEIA
jgi:glycine cleavage system H lipoate-binding protein